MAAIWLLPSANQETKTEKMQDVKRDASGGSPQSSAFIYLFIYLFIYFFIYLFFYLFIYLFL